MPVRHGLERLAGKIARQHLKEVTAMSDADQDFIAAAMPAFISEAASRRGHRNIAA
jgi:hypothetical protein